MEPLKNKQTLSTKKKNENLEGKPKKRKRNHDIAHLLVAARNPLPLNSY